MSQQNEINANYLYRLARQELENDTVQEINSDLYNSISKLLKNLKNEKHEGIEGKLNQAMTDMITDITSTLLKLRLEKATLGDSNKSVLLDEEKYILDSKAEMAERMETILSGILKGEPHNLGVK
jgi:DNA replication factor GINS|tara:strand:+ start:49 stop:423 length:375 start_codon:yes stop_codon:yes gene_type:complete